MAELTHQPATTLAQFGLRLGNLIYKYTLLICNCRRDIDSYNFSSPDEYLSLTSEDGLTSLSLENLTEQADRFLAGNDNDKERALSLLKMYESQVW